MLLTVGSVFILAACEKQDIPVFTSDESRDLFPAGIELHLREPDRILRGFNSLFLCVNSGICYERGSFCDSPNDGEGGGLRSSV